MGLWCGKSWWTCISKQLFFLSRYFSVSPKQWYWKIISGQKPMIQLKEKKTTTVTSNRCFFNCTIDIKQGSWQTALSMLYCIRNWYENHQTHDRSDCQDWWRSFSGRIIILADRFSLSAELQLRDRKKLLVNNVCLSATGVISISTEQLTGFSVSNPFNTHTF